MNLDKLQKTYLEEAEQSDSFRSLLKKIGSGEKHIRISGLGGSAISYILAAAAKNISRPVCIISASRERAEQIFDDLDFFGVYHSFHFPTWEILPYDQEEPHTEIASRQLDSYEALVMIKNGSKFSKGAAPIITAPLEAFLQKLLSPEFYKQRSLVVEWGKEIDTEALAKQLVDAGYERLPVVKSRGEFSIRGGIIDIFPLTEPEPLRLDLFGDEIESIRYFDPVTQRSVNPTDTIENVIIPPARILEMIHQSIDNDVPLSMVTEYLTPDTIFIIDEPDAFSEKDHHFEEIVERQYFEASAHGLEHLSPDKLYTDWDILENEIDRFTRISHTALPVQDSSQKDDIRFVTASFRDVKPSLDYYMDMISTKQRDDYLINVVCDNEGQVQRFDELLREREISAVQFTPGSEEARSWRPRSVEGGIKDIVLSVGGLHEGFIFSGAQAVFITDREIFGRYKRRRVYRKTYTGTPIAKPSEIRRGDYVVHIDHGIGKFLGIRTQNIDGNNVDLIELEYADEAKLLVPIEKIKNIQKYSVVENIQPNLDELGSKKWLNRKKKTTEKIEQMAQDLLHLYAMRQVARGHQYERDTVWQTEFESSFIYEETPDQMTAIHQVKRDLQGEKPMDRLVCGDVGYGKTEVALRAAFKVVQDKKQVAILAPTTILCQQHYNTFSERFAEYPFNVEMISRFRTRTEQKKILTRLKNGEVEIIVGTHRLLSKDVEFLNLGLVIVDEEQRFGVKHKERLKELRKSVDFLTLTATPIPRTLYMALSGLRDLSIINTPPPNRLPIKTKLIHWDDEMIREALTRELNRGGQVFFVHNRIHNIDQIASRLKQIMPGLSIAIAHGRLNEHELEKVMLEFIERKHDVLLSTSIIENGLDIPNVNTIIINRADAFGLAQLYQLRGRVGRDVKRAYAYLITPSGEAITDAAVRRLSAIEEFTELGVGFNIAMRDLEIRGSGNLLGKEQHGCIMSVGFDLYCSLLEKTVKKMKGEPVEEDHPVEIRWKAESYIPRDYIPVESQRLGIYKRLSEAKSMEVLEDIRTELRDRYGKIPEPVDQLLKITAVRILCSNLGIAQIVLTKDGFKITCEERARVVSLSEAIKKSVKNNGSDADVDVFNDNTLHIRVEGWRKAPQLKKAVNLLSVRLED